MGKLLYDDDMGELEEKNKKTVRRSKIQEAILLTIASGGRLGSELIIGQTIRYLCDIEPSPSSRMRDIVRSSASRLSKKGLLNLKNGFYSLTPAGEKVLSNWRKYHYEIKKPKRWDGKWRVIIFDISEKRRGAREEIRQILTASGFQRLQDSVWVYPYDCEDVIGLLKTELKIGREVIYMIVDQIENDKYLRMDFGLI